MDYKKEYKKRLDDAKYWHDVSEGDIPAVLEEIFPELCESDGYNWIPKEIIKYLKEKGDFRSCWIAWLEKQGEQKPVIEGTFVNVDEVRDDFMQEVYRALYSDSTNDRANQIIDAFDHLPTITIQKPVDNVEPKFKVGDWVVQENIGVYKVIEVCKSWYEVIDNKDKHYSIGFDKEYMCHLWTIQDAKDGDVLSYRDEISLYKHDIKNCTKQETTFGGFVYHCCYDGKRFITDSLYSLTEQDKIDIHPATKEQRDLLFQKMHEAGYEWDAEKKELKKIEQKHAEWSEEDERMYKSIIYSFDHNYPLLIQQQEFIKSLIFQKQWKPTKAQLTSLTIACDRNDRVGFDLTQLLKELKKL